MNNFQKLFIWMGLSLLSTIGLWESGEFIHRYISFALPQFLLASIVVSIAIGFFLFSNDKNNDGN
jgi:hypothetical protein